ncbi:MAG TPA: hypothetical protein VJC12_00980 [Candidatus Paceibacterota bacterium]
MRKELFPKIGVTQGEITSNQKVSITFRHHWKDGLVTEPPMNVTTARATLRVGQNVI